MPLLMVLLQSVQAEPIAPTHKGSVFASLQAVESSMGFQRYHPGLGGTVQRCTSTSSSHLIEPQSIDHCWKTSFRSGVNAEPIPSTNNGWTNANIVTTSLMVDGLRGFSLGNQPAQVGIFAGPGLDVIIGGTDAIVATVLPSLVIDIEV